MQIHSQGAALLLVWAANVIKQYAAYKWLGDEIVPKPIGFANLSPSYKRHDLQQITIETKIAMRKKNRAEADEYEKKMAKKKPKEGEEGEEGEEGGSGDEEVDEDEKERQRAKKEEQKMKDKQRLMNTRKRWLKRSLRKARKEKRAKKEGPVMRKLTRMRRRDKGPKRKSRR